MSDALFPPPSAADKAVAILRELDSLKTDEPGTAPLSDRAIARAYDFAAVFILILVVNFIIGVVAASTGHIHRTSSGVHVDTGALIAFDVALLAAFVLYEIGPALFGGRSFGKWRAGLTIVDVHGEPARFGRILVRFTTWFVPLLALVLAYSATFPGSLSFLFFALTVALVAGTWWSIWRDDSQRGWHDRIAGTQVVHSR
jgi:uncharacterized RDD family membrane protein YckC